MKRIVMRKKNYSPRSQRPYYTGKGVNTVVEEYYHQKDFTLIPTGSVYFSYCTAIGVYEEKTNTLWYSTTKYSRTTSRHQTYMVNDIKRRGGKTIPLKQEEFEQKAFELKKKYNW